MTASTLFDSFERDLISSRVAIDKLHALLKVCYSGLKEACTNQHFDHRLLDKHQLACFELARFSAEVSAADYALLFAESARARRSADSVLLEEKMALIYSAEVFANLRSGLAVRLADFQLDPMVFHQAVDEPQLLTWMSRYNSAAALESLGSDFQSAPDYLGDNQLDSAHQTMADNFRRFAKEVVTPQAENIHRFDTDIPDEILAPLTEMGVFGLSIPERYGGYQPDDSDDTLGMIVVTEALSTGSLCAAGSLITRPEIMCKALMAGGTEQQRKHWLPKLASGECLSAIAVTEPDFGSDVASVRLPASRTDGGWLLNGSKTWCTFCGKANVIVLLARTNPDPAAGHRGLSLFLVEKPAFDGHQFKHQQTEGGTVSGHAIPTIAYRGMHSFELHFDNYFVPDANLVGEEEGLGRGFYSMMQGFSGGRIQTAARAVGVMQVAYDKAIEYANDRQVFNQAIGDYQLTKVKLARMGMYLTVCRQFAYAVGRLIDRGEGQMKASLVKFFACKVSEWVTREAQQIHGGMGYSEETAVSRYFLDARVLSIFEGTEETLALKVIARNLVENAD
ncbi:MAG: acyl-CoA dehydrogenase family protein [Pseudomonadales bacterium]